MSGDKSGIENARLACRQFGMLYFHFCKTLRDALGEDTAFKLAQKAVFNLSLDRTDGARARAEERGLEKTVENFPKVNDLPAAAWSEWEPSMGGLRCPYAEVWVGYFRDHPWFKRFSLLYCDVIDTTNMENFTRTTSHRITKNLLWGDSSCEREYFESDEVKKGILSYGKRDGPPSQLF